MQQFVVPQFIDVEDKIFGPITVRQFVILLITAGFLFVSYSLFNFTIFIVTVLLFGGFALILAFAKINGQPFHYYLLNFAQTKSQPMLRVWRKDYTTAELNHFRKAGLPEKVEEVQKVTRACPEHIRDLSLLVNTGGYYRPDDTDL